MVHGGLNEPHGFGTIGASRYAFHLAQEHAIAMSTTARSFPAAARKNSPASEREARSSGAGFVGNATRNDACRPHRRLASAITRENGSMPPPKSPGTGSGIKDRDLAEIQL
jgi:hypothetical protein